ncbi:MAG: ATP synthase F1 subunit delta [Niabella sp.]
MPNPRLASRYAKALLGIAVEKNQLEKVYADIEWLQAAIQQNKDLLNLLRSPIIKAELKNKALTAVLHNNVGNIMQQFTTLMVNKKREIFIPEVASSFINQYKEYKNIHTATLTTAVPVSDAVKNKIVSRVKKGSGYEHIELIEKIDPAIIGGFKLQLGDQLVDASIAYDLKEVAKQFKNNDFIYKVR